MKQNNTEIPKEKNQLQQKAKDNKQKRAEK